MQKYLQRFQKLNFYLRKTENVQILLKGICTKNNQNFFEKIGQSAFFCSRLSKELLKVKIQWQKVGLNIDLVGLR